ncbi:MAG: CPBP family intramembrane metalloprotease [Clostridia bacterium]|nr:CPBP family intramembrane metalloprotease [Clostridia bacterium]
MRLERKASLLFLVSLTLYLVLSFALSAALKARGLENDPNYVYAASSLLVSVPAFLIPALIFRKRNADEMERFRAPKITHILVAAALGYGCMLLSQSLSLMNEAIFYGIEIESNSTTAEDLLNVNGIIMFFSIAVLPPVTEEFLMRGTMLESWRRTSPVLAAVLTSAVFAFLHLAPSNFTVYFGMGMVFATVYLITRNVWLTVVMHFVNNLVGVVSALIIKANPDAYSELLSGESGQLLELLGTRGGYLSMSFYYASSAAMIIVPMMILLRFIYKRNRLGMFAQKDELTVEVDGEVVYPPEEKKPSLFADPILWVIMAVLVVLNVIYGLYEFGVIGSE